MRRQRALDEAASALVAFACSPEASPRSVRQKGPPPPAAGLPPPAMTTPSAAGSVYGSVSRTSSTHRSRSLDDGACYDVSSIATEVYSSIDVTSESSRLSQWPSPSRSDTSSLASAIGVPYIALKPGQLHTQPTQHQAVHRAPSTVARHPLQQRMLPIPPTQSAVQGQHGASHPSKMTSYDAHLLTSAAVHLAACGLVKALDVATPAAAEPAAAKYVTAEEEVVLLVERTNEAQPCAPLASGDSSHGDARSANPTGDGGSDAPNAFSASVLQIICDEIAHVRALRRVDFARLCQLLDLPLEVGATWLSRISRLQALLLTDANPTPGSGDCAAAASAAFHAALDAPDEPARALMRRFGRQAVWCTVSLLRRLLREAKWPDGAQLAYTSTEAEARLASLAISTIGSSEH